MKRRERKYPVNRNADPMSKWQLLVVLWEQPMFNQQLFGVSKITNIHEYKHERKTNRTEPMVP